MYFNDTNKVDLYKMIDNSKPIYAHIHENRTETLYEHVELSLHYYYKLIDSKNLDNIFWNFENLFSKKLSNNGIILYKEMLLNTVYLHDIGKINCLFQSIKMDNSIFHNSEGNRFNYSNHSILSSIIYINHYFMKIVSTSTVKDRNYLFLLLILNSYVISKHHGKLDNIEKYLEELISPDGYGSKLLIEYSSIYKDIYLEDMIIDNNKVKALVIGISRMLRTSEQPVKLFIYERFLSSLLLTSDYYATSHFISNKEMRIEGIIQDINVFFNEYKNTSIYKSIREYEENYYTKIEDFSKISDINILRNELFLDVEKSLLKNIDKNIYYLEAPTGSGKSNVAFNLSFKLIEQTKELNKIFYVYPFNTLIEQNIDSLNKIFSDKNVMNRVAVINSIVPIKHDKRIRVDDEEHSDICDEDYAQSLLDRQFLQYPIILTTHISLFNFLFGVSKENLFPLCQIANSVIILDEIQSYKNKIWKEIITFLNYYSEMLNIKIIIMSATLPDLNQLFLNKLNSVQLIKNREKYFNNRIFQYRVTPDFSLIDSENIKEDLYSHIITTARNTNKNILIEFIKKSTAVDFHKSIKDNDILSHKKIELMTGDDNSFERKRIINLVKDKKEKGDIILIATQVIEAGVDIDMDIGYKDISLLDSEEQFIGRINRSSKNKDGGFVYFFNLDEAADIYRGDIRKESQLSIINKDFQDIFIKKDYGKFYIKVFDYLEEQAQKLTEDSYDSFMENEVKALNFSYIEHRMTLIDNRFEFSVFLNRIIYVNDNEELHGEEVWNEYISLLQNNNMDFPEKRIRLSEVNSKMAHFIYKINHNDFNHNGQIGDLYYIGDGEKYFENGKFDRGKFNGIEADMI